MIVDSSTVEISRLQSRYRELTANLHAKNQVCDRVFAFVHAELTIIYTTFTQKGKREPVSGLQGRIRQTAK